MRFLLLLRRWRTSNGFLGDFGGSWARSLPLLLGGQCGGVLNECRRRVIERFHYE